MFATPEMVCPKCVESGRQQAPKPDTNFREILCWTHSIVAGLITKLVSKPTESPPDIIYKA